LALDNTMFVFDNVFGNVFDNVFDNVSKFVLGTTNNEAKILPTFFFGKIFWYKKVYQKMRAKILPTFFW
jgi:hypothetical protein